MLKIEKLTENDISAIFEISKIQFGANGWQVDLFRDELQEENHFAYVAKLDGEVVAFLFFMKTEGERGEEFNILNIATKKECENNGIGTELFLFLVNFAKNMNIHNLWLEVRENNIRAIKFYENLGFQRDYVRKKYYTNGDNAIVMSLKIE